jgi:hypothetical protein
MVIFFFTKNDLYVDLTIMSSNDLTDDEASGFAARPNSYNDDSDDYNYMDPAIWNLNISDRRGNDYQIINPRDYMLEGGPPPVPPPIVRPQLQPRRPLPPTPFVNTIAERERPTPIRPLPSTPFVNTISERERQQSSDVDIAPPLSKAPDFAEMLSLPPDSIHRAMSSSSDDILSSPPPIPVRTHIFKKHNKSAFKPVSNLTSSSGMAKSTQQLSSARPSFDRSASMLYGTHSPVMFDLSEMFVSLGTEEEEAPTNIVIRKRYDSSDANYIGPADDDASMARCDDITTRRRKRTIDNVLTQPDLHNLFVPINYSGSTDALSDSQALECTFRTDIDTSAARNYVLSSSVDINDPQNSSLLDRSITNPMTHKHLVSDISCKDLVGNETFDLTKRSVDIDDEKNLTIVLLNDYTVVAAVTHLRVYQAKSAVLLYTSVIKNKYNRGIAYERCSCILQNSKHKTLYVMMLGTKVTIKPLSNRSNIQIEKYINDRVLYGSNSSGELLHVTVNEEKNELIGSRVEGKISDLFTCVQHYTHGTIILKYHDGFAQGFTLSSAKWNTDLVVRSRGNFMHRYTHDGHDWLVVDGDSRDDFNIIELKEREGRIFVYVNNNFARHKILHVSNKVIVGILAGKLRIQTATGTCRNLKLPYTVHDGAYITTTDSHLVFLAPPTTDLIQRETIKVPIEF